MTEQPRSRPAIRQGPLPAARRWLPVVVPVVLVGLAAVVTFVGLGEPSRIFFDETYYVNDARSYLQRLVEESFAVHPPVGKWLIAAGIALFGDDAFGWRALGAFEASLGVLLVYLTGRRLFERLWPAALAGLLLAADGLWIAQAHTAMLDIHLAFFVVLGAWLVVVDRDRRRSRVRSAGAVRWRAAAVGLPLRDRWPLVLAGVSFGLAVATKWSGALALLAAGLIVLGWELALRRRVTGRWSAALGPLARSFGVALVIVPVAVYALSWVPWLIGFGDSSEAEDVCEVAVEECDLGLVDRLGGLAQHHVDVASFHLTLDASHSYRAPAYTWPVMARPVVYYYETCSAARFSQIETTGEDGEVSTPEPCVVARGEAGEILNVGNPALWWTFLPASVLLAAGLARRDGRAGFVAAFWGAQFLPWLLASRPAFFFYMVPVVPFLALGVAYGALVVEEGRRLLRPAVGAVAGGLIGLAAGFGLEQVTVLRAPDTHWVGLGLGWLLGAILAAGLRAGPGDGRAEPGDARPVAGRVAAAVVAVAAVALLIYFYPVWTGLPLDESAIRARWWFTGWI